MYRNRYQQGGATDSRQQIFTALSQQGLLGEMSFEEFQQIPPQELRQMLQGIQQQMQGQGQGQEMQGQQMQGQGQEMVQAQYGLRSSNIPPYYNSRAMYQHSGNTTGSADYDIEEEEEDQTKTIRKAEKVFNKNNREEVDWNKGNQYGNLSTKMSGDLTNIGAGIAKEQFDTEGGRSAGNVGANAAAAFGQGASAGAAMGPVGAAVMGTGAAAGSLIGDLAVATPGDSTYTANQAGTLGTSLVPTTAAYGMRTPQQAEQSAIAAARNRSNNPNYVGSNYSYNPYGSVTRAGYNTGGRLKFQDSDSSSRNRWVTGKDGIIDYDAIGPYAAEKAGLQNKQGRPLTKYKNPYDWVNMKSSPGYTTREESEKYKSTIPASSQASYDAYMNDYNNRIADAKRYQQEYKQDHTQLQNVPFMGEVRVPNYAMEDARIDEAAVRAANKRAHGWRKNYERDPVRQAHRGRNKDSWGNQASRNQKRYGGISNNDYRMAYEMGGGYYGKKY